MAEGQLRAILDNVLDGIITIDARGTVESFNPACERIFGFKREEVIGHNATMLMPEPYHMEHDGYLESRVMGREVRGQRKGGTSFPINISVSAFVLDGEKHFCGIIHDISTGKEAQKSLALLAAIVESSEDAIISKTLGGIITSWNKGATQLFGYTPEEAIGQNISLLIPGDRQEEERNIIKQLRQGRRIEYSETVRLHKNGSAVHISLTMSPIRDDKGHIIGASKIARDIHERREVERTRQQLRQAQKMEAIGQLTGGIAHDFNNLLAVIIGNLDFMYERTEENGALREFIKPSLEAAEHGAELTQQLLAFGRKQALQPKVLSINELLSNFIVLVRHTLGERIETILSLAPDIWNVNVDANQLQSALLNLAVNARDAMPAGGKLVFETKNILLDDEYPLEGTSGEYVMVAVSDTGEGMTSDIIEKAFEPFFTTKNVGKGSGMGLSMVYGFVKQSADLQRTGAWQHDQDLSSARRSGHDNTSQTKAGGKPLMHGKKDQDRACGGG